jgi:hypothetical protein
MIGDPPAQIQDLEVGIISGNAGGGGQVLELDTGVVQPGI